jgi:uncharacterized caspase-like protein
MRSLIQDFVEAIPNNAVSFIYYSGHAVQMNSENYLIPTGAQLQLCEFGAPLDRCQQMTTNALPLARRDAGIQE